MPDEVTFLVDRFDTRLRARNPAASLPSVDLTWSRPCSMRVSSVSRPSATTTRQRQRRDLRLGLKQVRQALRDIIDEAPVMDDRPPKELARLAGAMTIVYRSADWDRRGGSGPTVEPGATTVRAVSRPITCASIR